MSTVRGIETVLTSRDLFLLRTLVVTRVLESEQVQIIGGFGSVRRTNRRLLKLVRAGMLRRWFVGTRGGGQKAIYGLSPTGTRLIDQPAHGLITWKQDALITTSQFLTHQQAINRVYLSARFRLLVEGSSCTKWQAFREPLSDSIPLVPDAYLEIAKDGVVYPMFLEVDCGTESSTVWKKKAQLYLQLAIAKEFEQMFDRTRLRILIVFSSDRRLNAIRRVIAERTEKLFWFTTEDRINSDGLCGSIWLRPKGNEKIPLV